MTQTVEQVIDDIIIGDDVELVFTVSNVPTGVTFSQAWLTIKKFYSDTSALIQKIVTSIDSNAGNITDTTITIRLQPADTILFYPYAEYVFDIQVKTNADKLNTVFFGKIIAKPQVTT